MPWKSNTSPAWILERSAHPMNSAMNGVLLPWAYP